MRKAIIVESPTKTRTLSRFLGDEYKLLASRGHVRDLLRDGLAVDVDNDFEPEYEILPSQKKTVRDLKKELKDIDEVYLATDPDREGEAIAWHLVEALGLHDAKRIEFNEITQEAVLRALEHPGTIDIDRVNAQQARRILDRLVGYKLSPLLWRRIGSKGQKDALSAGRVQSAALRLVCDREREIAGFTAEEYWSIEAILTPGGVEKQFAAELKTRDGEQLDLHTEDQTMPIVEQLAQSTFVCASITKTQVKRNPQTPYRTSTLQRAAAARFRFRARRTMDVAQRLYEGIDIGDGTHGLITYMRTDSTRVSAEARNQATDFIKQHHGENYLGKGATAKARKGVQDAHEGIRPTDVNRTPEMMNAFLDNDEARLYELIWRRFVASQMAPAVYSEVAVEITAGEYGFRASGSVLVFDGWQAVLPQERDETQAQVLGELEEGQAFELVEIRPEQHFTKPPPRYTEATLVRALEENGVGRPSTYAPTIDTLRQRKYVRMQQQAFIPTTLGLVVNDYLVANFPEIVDIDFTANIEERLDTVQSGETQWQEILRAFHGEFEADLEAAAQAGPRVLEGEACPECGGRLLERYSLFGKFAGCEKYPECQYTRDLLADVLPQQPTEEVGRECPECGKPLVYRTNRRGQQFIGCTGYPDCTHTEALDADGKPIPPPQQTDVKCDRCGANMVLRQSRRGPFLGCSNYPKCRGTKPAEALAGGGAQSETVAPSPDAQQPAEPELDLKCEKCGAPMVVKRGKRGPFIACTGYPECKNTKSMAEAEGAGYERPKAEVIDEACPECEKPLAIRSGRKGRFIGCTGYPRCRYTRDLNEPGETADE